MGPLGNPLAVTTASAELGLAGSSLLVGTVRRSTAQYLADRIKVSFATQHRLMDGKTFWSAEREGEFNAALEDQHAAQQQLRLLIADALGISVDDAMVIL